MKKPKKYTINDSASNDQLQEPAVEYQRASTLKSLNPSSLPGQYTDEEFMEYLDKAEQRFAKGEGIPHEEAIKQIHSWK